MTALALGSKAAVMHILTNMAAAAYLGQDHFTPHRPLVILIATGLFMRAVEFEAGLVVIEVPRLPIARVVAILAFRTELALVHIIFLVA